MMRTPAMMRFWSLLSRAARRFMPVVLVLAAATLAALCAAGPAAAKSFSVDDVVIDASIRLNGDLAVHEQRVVDFDGRFRYVYWDYLKKGSQGIEIKSASGPQGEYELSSDTLAERPGTYSVADLGDRVRVQLNFSLADTQARFAVRYVAKGAATRWADTGELYWKFIGDESEVSSGRARITITPPDGVSSSEVRAWAHGPLHGEVTIRPDASVELTVSPLPAKTFVEARLLFPADALSRAPVHDQACLDEVLAQEQALADQANRERLWARVQVLLWTLLGIGAPLTAVILAMVLYLRYGREPRTVFQAQYLRDFPDPRLPPALVDYIWQMGGVDQNAAMATLLDLVDRGVVGIDRQIREKRGLLGRKQEVDYALTLRRERMSGLSSFEALLLHFLFDDIAQTDTFAMGDLRKFAKKRQVEWTRGYKSWTDDVKAAGQRRGFLDKKADKGAFWASTAGFGALVGAGAAGVVGAYPWFLIGIAPSALVILLSRAIKRRSQEAAELHAQYAAIRRYLRDFGRLDEKPPDAVVLWQHFLVLAVVFGMADEVVKHLQVKVPEVMQDPAFHTMAGVMVVPHGGGQSAFAAMSGGFSAAMSVASSKSSSGSGGGGGFSGGGGGGGGGGGFGAG